MTKDDRRDQLMVIMQAKFSCAATRDDFTPEVIVGEADVSVVWFYKLVGREFIRLRDKLPGGPTREGVVAKLRREIKELRRKVKELKEGYQVSMHRKLNEAIRHIEFLDAENRMLREELALLSERVTKGTVIIS
jgi:hypothetical protein